MKQFADLSPEEQDQFVKTYYDLFAGNAATYAIRFDFGDRAAYVPSTYVPEDADDPKKQHFKEQVDGIVRDIGTPEFGPEAIRAHLEGRQLLGVYPLRPDSTVRWFAFDFDKKEETDPDPYAA